MANIHVSDLVPNEMTDSRFRIKKENIPSAFSIAKEIWDENEDKTNLSEISQDIGFVMEEDEQGINKIHFVHNNASTFDMTNFFEALAPYVEAGSYIEMAGTEGGAWRWMFDGKTMSARFPIEFIWPASPLDKNQFFGFTHSSRQNYWSVTRTMNDYADEVMFGIHDKGGGVACELAMRWYELNEKMCPCFEAFISDIPPLDSSMLTRILLSAMDYGDKLTPQEFCKCLIWLGFKDLSDSPFD